MADPTRDSGETNLEGLRGGAAGGGGSASIDSTINSPAEVREGPRQPDEVESPAERGSIVSSSSDEPELTPGDEEKTAMGAKPGPGASAIGAGQRGGVGECRRGRRADDNDDEKIASAAEAAVPGPDDDDDGGHAERAGSRASSSRSRALSVVPPAFRRGLLHRFCVVVPEVTRPYDYQRRTKWAITAIVALAAAAAPMGSSIFYPALPEIARALNASPTVTNLSVALYMISISLFPLWWSSLSETYGRRSIYVVSFLLFIAFSILSAVSRNVAMLIVMRMLSGGAAASVQAVGAGTIADVWEVRERGQAMGIFYLGPLMGPLLAPIIGGALSQALGWQATMYFLAIYGGFIWVAIVFFLPETLPRRKPLKLVMAAAAAAGSQADGGPAAEGAAAADASAGGAVLEAVRSDDSAAAAIAPAGAAGSAALTRTSTRQSIQASTRKTGRVLKHFLLDPLKMLLYLRFPPVAITVYYAAIAFGSLFILNISIQATFSAPNPHYGFSQLVVGLLYLPPSIGYVTASVTGGRWMDHIMARNARAAGRFDAKGRLIYLPEDRLGENAWLAATMYPAALVWYGWTAEKGVHWIVPSIANFVFGFGSMLIFATATTMLTEFMPKQASAGVAVNNFVRNILSCLGAIVGQPLITALGNGWLFVIIGLFCWLTGNACLLALRLWGPRWRTAMDKALE